MSHQITEQLTIYLPTSIGLLSPEGRKMVDQILSNPRTKEVMKIEIISDKQWLAMGGGK